MRRFAVLLLLLAASATVPAHATPAACAADPCSIATAFTGYTLPVTEIASGQKVEWTTTEASHPTSDSTNAETRCFLELVGSSVAPIPIRFDVTAGGLSATTAPGTADTSTVACANADALPNGAYLLTFHCMLHTWMNGALIVDPVART